MKLCNFSVGKDNPLFLIAGPCVIESFEHALGVAAQLREITEELDMPFIFKASYDKANRSSHQSFRGPGLEHGLEILATIRERVGCPVLTDVHTPQEAEKSAAMVDVLQTPAFLCRQTDLIQAAAATGKPVNIKKGQFLSPSQMQTVLEKATSIPGSDTIMICERGSSFGYHDLVVDMRGLAFMNEFNFPVVFDATHSVQQPGALGNRSGGQREYVPVLARAAVAVGVAGIFMETHPDPDRALSDGPNAWPLDQMKSLLKILKEIDSVAKGNPGRCR